MGQIYRPVHRVVNAVGVAGRSRGCAREGAHVRASGQEPRGPIEVVQGALRFRLFWGKKYLSVLGISSVFMFFLQKYLILVNLSKFFMS